MMCGRLIQKSTPEDYLDVSGWQHVQLPFDVPTWRPRYNLPPGTAPLVLRDLEGEQALAPMWWGYKPPWYKRQPVINARLDTILKGSGFWKPLLTRRVLVPADGWYEWTGEPGDRQPWMIHARDGRPVLLAGITAWRPGAELDAAHGMAIITDDAAGGMVDLHDRRPIALTPDDAREWADPATSWDDAREILGAQRPEGAFEWHPVTRAMSNARYDRPDAVEPVSLPT